MTKIYLAACIAGLVITALPRFNMNDPWIIKKIAGGGFTDATEYLKYTLYLKGDDSLKDSLSKPFTYRFLTPFMASLFPIDPFTAINLLNLIYLVSSLIFVYLILRYLGFSDRLIFFGCMIYGISFPVFWYGTTGNVDPGVLFYSAAGIYAILNKKWILLYSCFILGILTKETIILLFPFLFVYLLIEKNIPRNKKYLILFTCIILVSLCLYILIKTSPGRSELNWLPSAGKFLNNLVRVKTYLSTILTFGIPGFLLSWYILKHKTNSFSGIEFAFLAGASSGFLLFLYSLFSAYSDGRFIWYIYPFAVPLAVSSISKEFKKGNFIFLRQLLKSSS